mgnify:FL=1
MAIKQSNLQIEIKKKRRETMKKRTGRVLCAATLMGMLAGSVIPVCAAENGDSLDPVTLHFIFYGDKKSATDEVWDAIADYTRDTLNCDSVYCRIGL